MRWLPLLLLCPVALSGCDELFGVEDTWEPDTQDTDTGSNTTGCPADLTVPAAVDVSVRSLTINGSDYQARFATAPLDGVPIACVSDDGLQAQVLLEVGGEPFAWVRSYATTAGSQDLIGGTGAEIEAIGLDPQNTWSDGSWSSGRWSVTKAGQAWTHSLSANGTSNASFLNVELYVEVTP